MSEWLRLDVRNVFSLHVPLLELAFRASVLYLAVCFVLRLVPKRHAGSLSPNDVVTLVMVGGVAASALAREPTSEAGVLVVIATVVGWNYALNWLGQRYPALRPLLQEPPTRLVHRGRVLADNLRRELVTEDDIRTQARKQGIAEDARIVEAYLEADGSISVVRWDGGG
ncbi:MAG: DUF421 domain-containing protein [Gemmataceae bacterium]